MRSFTSETFIIWTQNFSAQNTSNMRFSQKNEVTSLKVDLDIWKLTYLHCGGKMK